MSVLLEIDVSPATPILGSTEPQPSKWNYTLPTLALTCWSGAVISAIVLAIFSKENAEASLSQLGPESKERLVTAIKGFCYAGLSTIPASVGATIAKGIYKARHSVRNGFSGVVSQFCKTFKESLTRIGKREGIIVNTIGAPLLPIYVVCQISSQVMHF
jgi:hypothetical protein